MSYDHIAGCEILDSDALIVPYPEFDTPKLLINNINQCDNFPEKEDKHETEISDVKLTGKRKRETNYGKGIYYIEKYNNYEVKVTKDGKLKYVGRFRTQEEAVTARDAFNNGETVKNPGAKESAYGKYISYNKSSKKYEVTVWKNRKQHYVGSFSTKEEAVAARDANLRGETEIVIKPSSVVKRNKSVYGKYIYYREASNKYMVKVAKSGVQYFLGLFLTQEEAEVVRDAFMRGETIIKPSVKESAHGKGIKYDKRNDMYEVRVKTEDKKQHYVGSFSTQVEAVAARDAYLIGEPVIKHVTSKSTTTWRISYNKRNCMYQVRVRKDGKLQYTDSFPTQEEAEVARDALKREEYGANIDLVV